MRPPKCWKCGLLLRIKLDVSGFAAQQLITLKYKIVQVSLKFQLAILRSFTVQGLIGVVRVVPPSDANYAATGLYASTLLLRFHLVGYQSRTVAQFHSSTHHRQMKPQLTKSLPPGFLWSLNPVSTVDKKSLIPTCFLSMRHTVFSVQILHSDLAHSCKRARFNWEFKLQSHTRSHSPQSKLDTVAVARKHVWSM